MKRQIQHAIAFGALAATFVMVPVAMANPVQTPLRSPVVVAGNSNGTQENDSCRGFQFSGAPTQVVRVTQPNTALRLRVEGSGPLALLVTGGGNPMCLPSSNGAATEVPGVWQPGTYSFYVGDRADSVSFTLSISQDN